MSESQPSSEVLQEALDKLRDRRARLEPFVQELRECESSIRVLERAMNGGKSASTSAPSQAPNAGPRMVGTKRKLYDLMTPGRSTTITELEAVSDVPADVILEHMETLVSMGKIVRRSTGAYVRPAVDNDDD